MIFYDFKVDLTVLNSDTSTCFTSKYWILVNPLRGISVAPGACVCAWEGGGDIEFQGKMYFLTIEDTKSQMF